jgi:hypothetical protein
VLHKIATDVRSLPGVIGIQVVNEAVYDAHHMYEFYDQAIGVIGGVDNSIPVYISDGWDLNRALQWTNERKGGNPVVVDTHRYFTFSEKDRSQSPQEIIGRIGGELGELDGKEGALCDRGEAQVVVGEWYFPLPCPFPFSETNKKQELCSRRPNLVTRPRPRKGWVSEAVRTSSIPEMAAAIRGIIFLDL